jgi:hypothetical protein
MTQREQQQARIPEFSSREEMAAWFDTHDVGDYIDEFEKVDVQVDRNLTKRPPRAKAAGLPNNAP